MTSLLDLALGGPIVAGNAADNGSSSTAPDWLVGRDARGNIFLFRQGATNAQGQDVGIGNLTHYANLGSDINKAGAELGKALTELGATSSQVATVIQSIDVGAIEQGKGFVEVPRFQQPGETLPSMGQAPSSSSAVPTNILPSPIPPSVGNQGGGVLGSLGSIFSGLAVFGDLGFWKGIGLVLAGAGLLIFAALEIKGSL